MAEIKKFPNPNEYEEAKKKAQKNNALRKNRGILSRIFGSNDSVDENSTKNLNESRWHGVLKDELLTLFKSVESGEFRYKEQFDYYLRDNVKIKSGIVAFLLMNNIIHIKDFSGNFKKYKVVGSFINNENMKVVPMDIEFDSGVTSKPTVFSIFQIIKDGMEYEKSIDNG